MKSNALLKRIAQIGAAWGSLHVVDTVYDYVLYPLAISNFGVVSGGAIMTAGSALICYMLLVSYQRSGQDWLGVNVVEQIKSDGNTWVNDLKNKSKGSFLWSVLNILLFVPSHVFLLTILAMKKGDFVAFIVLSITQDPFKTTVFLKHGCFDGLNRRDWFIFWSSVLLSNLWWTCLSTMLVEFIKWICTII